ncbi:hypothetical protein HK104_005579, partial [Borealophlyctis nickersoniae]
MPKNKNKNKRKHKRAAQQGTAPPTPNTYTGFHPTPSWSPDRIDPSKISPRDFFTRYIATRTPCILTSHLPDPTWFATAQWTLPYLTKRAGSAIVKVEKQTDSGTFGSGQERVEMPFGEFIRRLENGEKKLYMTTQYDVSVPEDVVDEDARRDMGRVLEYCQPPLTHLLDSFPARPSLLSTLAPQQVNLWMGAAPPPPRRGGGKKISDQFKGTSSGLHHDFQDNLYILLRGRKRFTIFSPGDAKYLYLNGNVSRIHPNGLIQYEEAGNLRDDGAYLRDVAAWKVGVAERELEKARETGGDVAAAERAVDEAVEEALKYGLDDTSDGEGVDDDFHMSAGEDGDDEDEDEDEGFTFGDPSKAFDSDPEVEAEPDTIVLPNGKRKQKSSPTHS